MIKKNYLRIPMLAATMIAGITTVSAQQLAFPEAAGWGRYAKGARASSSPTVYITSPTSMTLALGHCAMQCRKATVSWCST